VPLPLPVIDRRTFDDLVAEARALLPGFAPEWTDYNASDPGITFVELFAWITEILTYRADRVPAAQMRAYLRWLGIEPAPAQPASTALALRLPPGGAAQVLPAGLKVADPTTRLVFEVDDPITISPAWLELDLAEGTSRGVIWTWSNGRYAEETAGNCRSGHEFFALGPNPAAGDALLLGFDCVPASPGDIMDLHIWTDSWRSDAATRRRLIEADVPDPGCPPESGEGTDTRDECAALDCSDVQPAPAWAPSWHLHYSARVVWEGWDGSAWTPMDVLADETRALTLTGPVRLSPSTPLQPDPPTAPATSRWWIRCRLDTGGYECPPKLAGIALNAVPATHAALITGPQVLGLSRGNADECYHLPGLVAELGADAVAQPVLAGTTKLRLTAGGPPDDDWTEVAYWDRTGPADKHYRTDPATNAICFGNGWAGRVPPAGWAVEALSYRVGGGIAGNLPAGRLTKILTSGPAGLAVRQPFDAVGGTAAETLDSAHGRALDLLNRPSRGVTVADWEALALDIPGVPVARAAAIPGFHPSMPCWSASGVVTVVVVPACGRPPLPGHDFLAAVDRVLQRHRPVTTELHVVGPTYIRVTVTATLHTSGAPATLRAGAQAALDAFFDPLTGGPDGTGWPFGRGVLASDLLTLLARLPGVRHVDDLALSTDDTAASCDNLDLCPTDLVDSQPHRITVVEGAR